MTKVLVTGGTGHAGFFSIVRFLEKGYDVNTSVRDLLKTEDLFKTIKDYGNFDDEAMSKLKFFQAVLGEESGWEDALEGVTYVNDVAYPFINNVPLEQLIDAALNGTMSLAKLAVASPSVKHFCFTSSYAAVAFGDTPKDGLYYGSDWTPEDSKMLDGYMLSKIIVEKKLWEFFKSDENLKSKYPTTFNVICPYGIYGPVPTKHYSGSLAPLKSVIDGSKAPILGYTLSVTDVRNLADAYVAACENKDSYWERFTLQTDDAITFDDMTKLAVEKYPALKSQASTEKTPFILGARLADCSKAKKLLGYKPTPIKETILDSVKSIVVNEKLV